MNTLHNGLDLVGRILLAAFFIPSGIVKIGAYGGIAAYMTAHGVPAFLLPLVIFTEIVIGLAVLVGWRTRTAAFLLGGYSILAVLIFHMHPADDTGRIIQMAELAVGGGLWVLAAHGARGWSLDHWLAHRDGDRHGARPAVPTPQP